MSMAGENADRLWSLFRPMWCSEGFVIKPGVYERRGSQVFTTLGWATPIEESEQPPTVGPALDR